MRASGARRGSAEDFPKLARLMHGVKASGADRPILDARSADNPVSDPEMPYSGRAE